MSGFKERVARFEPLPGSEGKLQAVGSTEKLQRVPSGDRRLLDGDPEDVSLLSKSPPGTPNGLHGSSKLEEEVAKHQITRSKLQNAEKEIRELRKLYEKLANKHKKISYLFNELKTVVDEDPPIPIPRYTRMTHVSAEEPIHEATITPTGSPSLSRNNLEPNASPLLPGEHVPTTTSVVVVTPPTASPNPTTASPENESVGAGAPPPSSPPSPIPSPSPSPTLTTQLSSGSLSNSTGSLPSASDRPVREDKSASPRPGRSWTKMFNSGSAKHKELKSHDSWIYDRRELIIAQFLKAEKSYSSNLSVIVDFILDEPFQGMDETMVAVANKWLETNLTPKQTLIIVTHHKEEIPRFVDHMLRLEKGRVVEMV